MGARFCCRDKASQIWIRSSSEDLYKPFRGDHEGEMESLEWQWSVVHWNMFGAVVLQRGMCVAVLISSFSQYPPRVTDLLTLNSIMPTTPAPINNAFTNMPPRTADLDETWAFLNDGVDHIMTRLETGLSFAGYTSLYTTVYNYCTSTKMHGKLDGNRSSFPRVASCQAPN